MLTDELPMVNVEKRIEPVRSNQHLNRYAGQKSSSPVHVQLSSNVPTVHKLESDHVDQLLLRDRGEIGHQSSSDHYSNSIEAKEKSGFNRIHENLRRFPVGYESFTNQLSSKANDNNNVAVHADKHFHRFPGLAAYKSSTDHHLYAVTHNICVFSGNSSSSSSPFHPLNICCIYSTEAVIQLPLKRSPRFQCLFSNP